MSKQIPSVLIELVAGILIGAVPLIGPTIKSSSALNHLAELGAILLLFETGLKSTFDELRQVGAVASRVAVVGMALPLLFGFLVSWLFGATDSLSGHIFIGATLTATSVGITARVLRDLNFDQSQESKIIMAAAVFDDILGLVLLALVAAMVQAANGGVISWQNILMILIKTGLFLVLAWAFGKFFVTPFFTYAQKSFRKIVFISGLVLCLVFSFLAHEFGLAPILGAYFAGLMIDPKELDVLMQKNLKPITKVLVPLFFIMMGAKVDLSALGDTKIFLLGLVLTVAAVLGKVISGYVVDKKLNRLVIGVGMVPRGEVGLIFASMGVLAPSVFGAIILMVIITSVVSPVWLGKILNRSR
jgi:Kef-type K+ transport system membrane component KefB